MCAALLGGAAVALAAAALGLFPVAADVVPSALEARVLGAALRASVARRARATDEPALATGATAGDLAAGAEIYDGACARCHGRIDGRPSAYGAALYPPAPPLPGHRSRLTEAELAVVVRHGIRMTGMPAWGGMLADRDIARVVAVVARFGTAPAGASP
ncbi:MAG TPA: cytochrome c [Candidatus Binatia bacterium]